MPDEQLMALVKEGHKLAFAEIYDRYAGKLLNFFFRMLNKDEHKAQDFMQDIFMKIIENPNAFDPLRRFDTWVFNVAYNLCKNEYRRQNVRESYSIEKLNEIKQEAMPELTELSIDLQSFETQLSEALNNMEEIHRLVFLLRYQQDLSVKEIAALIDCPEGTVKSRLFYATRSLAATLSIFDPNKN
ncbi:MAG: RNA polymerase sigma factor [Bacteroidales bacterium]|nr:RNA polymerase sigma factor [Bacteroidales bacterium]